METWYQRMSTRMLAGTRPVAYVWLGSMASTMSYSFLWPSSGLAVMSERLCAVQNGTSMSDRGQVLAGAWGSCQVRNGMGEHVSERLGVLVDLMSTCGSGH